MIKSFYILIAVLLLTIPGLLFSDMKPFPIEEVLIEIRQEQGLKSNENINIQKVSPARLEELGDSVMEVQIGNTALHEVMDNRMGGEGSPSLKAFHQRLGINYLSGYPLGMMGLPYNDNDRYTNGGNYMMYGNYFPGMMGGFGWGLGGIFMGLIFLVLIGVLIFFVVRSASGGGWRGFTNSESPMEILKKRYAKGEITKEDFEKMKKDII